MTFSQLLDSYPLVQLAQPCDNKDILHFIQNISMKTKDGSLIFDRNPNFFSLTDIQGEKSFVFLFKNKDQTIGGIGCLSITKMTINGEEQYLGYTSDLKLSPKIDRETRIQFYKFYEELSLNFSSLEELKGCRFVINCILDNNTAAIKSLVKANSKKRSQLIHQPIYAYENINIVARLPKLKIFKPKFKVLPGEYFKKEEIIDFLTQNFNKSQIQWSREEILRRQEKTQFQWSDFKLITDNQNNIIASSLLLSDNQYRAAKISNPPRSLLLSQKITSLFGMPEIIENEPLRTAYLSFVKTQTTKPKERADLMASMLNTYFNELRFQETRFHSITLHEPQTWKMKQRLTKKGFLAVGLNSTIYQVVHQDLQSQDSLNAEVNSRPDFDVVFH